MPLFVLKKIQTQITLGKSKLNIAKLGKTNIIIVTVEGETMNDLEKLAQNAGRAAEVLKTMSHPDRLMILCMLLENELCVSELNEVVPLSQSALSQHLAVLRNSELVRTRRVSQTIYYSIQDEAPVKIIAVLKELFCKD